jgi:hypothetical protein
MEIASPQARPTIVVDDLKVVHKLPVRTPLKPGHFPTIAAVSPGFRVRTAATMVA